MHDAERVFFCALNPACRGAVGYTTGAHAPKTGGVMLGYDFLNTPTAILLWRFIYIKITGTVMAVKFKDFMLSWYRAYHLYNMDDPRKQRWIDLHGKAFEINSRGEYVFLDDKRTAAQKGWTNPRTGELDTELPSPDLSDEDWRYFYKLCRTTIRNINDRRADLLRNDPDKNPLPIDKWFGNKNLKPFSEQTVAQTTKDKLSAFATLVRTDQRLKNKLSDSFSSEYSLETFLSDLIDQDYSRNSQHTVPKIQTLIRILPGLIRGEYDYEEMAYRSSLDDDTINKIFSIFIPAVSATRMGDKIKELENEFDALSEKLDPENEEINPAQLRQFQDPSCWREILKSLYASDKPDKKSAFHNQFSSYGGAEIAGYMNEVVSNNNYESGPNELIPKLDKEQSLRERINEKIDDFVDEHFKRLTSRADRHIYIDPNASPIVNAIIKEKISPTDGIAKILEKKDAITKRVLAKQPNAKKACDFLFEALNYIKSSGDMDATLDGALRNGRKAEAIAFEIIKYAISKRKVNEAKSALEVLAIMRYDTFSSAHWEQFHKSQSGGIFGNEKLSFNKGNESVAFITRSIDSVIFAGINAVFWTGVIGRNLFQHARGRMNPADAPRLKTALEKIESDSNDFISLETATRQHHETRRRLETARNTFTYARIRRDERADLDAQLTALRAEIPAARVDPDPDRLTKLNTQIAQLSDELAGIDALMDTHRAEFDTFDRLQTDIQTKKSEIDTANATLASLTDDAEIARMRARIRTLNFELGALNVRMASYDMDTERYMTLECEDRVATELYERLQSAADRGVARETDSKPYNAPKSDIENMQMLMAFWNAVNGYNRAIDVNSYNIFRNIKDVRKSANLNNTFNEMFSARTV